MYKSIDSTRIRNLKVIAMIKQGQKLCTRLHHYSIDDYNTTFTYKAIFRWFNGESRTETIDSISKLVESCVQQTGLSQSEKIRLANQFKEVIKGVKNLAMTYKDDSTACAGLEFIIETIEDFIVANDNTYVRETTAVEMEEVEVP